LTPEYKDGFAAPFVKESVIQIGMRFVEKIDIKINNTILIVGAIESIYAPEGIIQEDGYVDIEAAGTITCSGLDGYHKTQKLARLSYAKPDQALTHLDGFIKT